jgi:methionyl-tRNA synthetase
MSKQKFYLTTPIYYVNARPHIGHAYTTIVGDVIARRHRLLGDDTFFLTGTDEHGQKVQRSAANAGIPPQQFTDEVSASFRNLWKRMGITNDDYIRTTEERHKQGVQRLWKLLEERGFIYLSTYTGQYSIGEEMFVDGPPGTIGPDGKPTETITEENYFFKLSEFQKPLLDFYEANPDFISPAGVRNEVLSFVRGGAEYAAGALKDLSISRTTFDWGIPVPGNEKHVIYVWLDALVNYITAIGYGSDDPAEQEKFRKYWPADIHLVGKEITRFHCVYWPAFLMAAGLPLPKSIVANGWLLFEESKMSKSRGNIVRTETILDAFGGLKLMPPDAPGPELSDAYWKHEQDLFASDVIRYFLLREIPFGQDGSFSFDALVQRYNSDLANGYGNLVSRTLTLIAKSSAGVVEDCLEANSLVYYQPERKETHNHPANDEVLAASEGQMLGWKMTEVVDSVGKKLEQNSFADALTTIAAAIASVDQFMTSRKPWAATETELSQRGRRSTLYTAAECIRIITALLYPVLPYATAKVWDQLGLGDIEQAAKNGELKNLEWGGLKPGTKLGDLGPIFPRAPKELIQVMTDMEQNNTPKKPEPSKLVDEKIAPSAAIPESSTDPGAPPRTSSLPVENPGAHVGASSAVSPELAKPPAPHSEAPASEGFAASASGSAAPDTPQIAIDDFVKIDLRVAQIVVAERIPKADKLLRLEVDLGYEKRQILSGIAEWYTPEELIGRRIVVIANLAPRKMRGLESHGMLLAASHGENGKPVLATFGEEIALGSRLK